GLEVLKKARDCGAILGRVRRGQVEEKKVAPKIPVVERPPQRGRPNHARPGRYGFVQAVRQDRVLRLRAGRPDPPYPRNPAFAEDKEETETRGDGAGKAEPVPVRRSKDMRQDRRRPDAKKRHDHNPVDVELELVEEGVFERQGCEKDKKEAVGAPALAKAPPAGKDERWRKAEDDPNLGRRPPRQGFER